MCEWVEEWVYVWGTGWVGRRMRDYSCWVVGWMGGRMYEWKDGRIAGQATRGMDI